MCDITRDYIRYGNARPGTKAVSRRFGVAHDTGNPGSTAYDNRHYFDAYQPSASAHTFIDDKVILEIIPLDEKAWHVRYGVGIDDEMFGDDANDAAVGVELCWGGDIVFREAYKRYVWYWAYLCKKYDWDPLHDIVAHSTLDPSRRTDPENALNRYGITWNQFLKDVVTELEGGKIEAPERKTKAEVVYQTDASFIGKRLESHFDGVVDFYSKPTWDDTYRVGYLKKGYGFPDILNKMMVDGSPQYKVANSNGDIFYVTAHPKYVHVEGESEPVETPAADDTKFNLDSIVPYPGHYINRGDRGKNVKRIQRAVGVKPDGIFGPITEQAVKDYQRRHGLAVDGIVGPKTWGVMF